MTTYNVGTQTELNAAITNIAAGGATTDIINFTSSITLTGNLTRLSLTGDNVTINGNGHTLNGANTYGGFVVQNGTVAVNDLAILNTTAKGGLGNYANGNGGGGGAGLGGGLFVGANANVTISNVNFTGSKAIGGTGGSNNVNAGATGGLWNGFIDNGAGGFGMGGAGPQLTGVNGGNGGFGGGGGAATSMDASPATAGLHGYGGGDGGISQYASFPVERAAGGGGMGAGGAIFVDTLGSLTIAGGTISGGSAQAGAAGTGSNNPGRASHGIGTGSGIFLHGTSITFKLAAGQTSTVSDAIHDGDGVGSIALKGAGTLHLGASNLFSGGVSIYGGGTLSLGHALSAGSGAISFLGYGTLQLASGVNIANTIKNFSLSDSISLVGFNTATSVSFNAGTKLLAVINGSGTTETFQFESTYGFGGYGFVATTDANGKTTIKIPNLLADGDFKMVDLSNTGPGVSIDPTLGNHLANVLTGWIGTGGFGAFAPTAAASTGFAGDNIGFLTGASSAVSQTVAAPGNYDSFRLDIDLGSRLDAGNGSSVKVEIFAGSTLVKTQTYDTSTSTQALGSVKHYTIDTGALDPSLKGLAVKVVLTNMGSGQVLFDDVVLTGVDTTAPVVTNVLFNDTGSSAVDGITNVATLTGTGDANTIVHFTVDGTPIAQTATTNGAGVWTFTPTGLSNGEHTIVASQTDSSSNTGTKSLTFTLDTIAPVVTNVLLSDTGSSGTDRITNVATLTGTGDPNTVVHFTVDGQPIAGTTTTNGAGAWTFAPTGLSDGEHTIVASQTDVSGNTATSSRTFTLDTTTPVVTNTLSNDTGASGSDKITSVATLTGTADANSVVHFTVDGQGIAQTATTNGLGVWTFTPTGLADGEHIIVASQTDTSGNVGTASLTFTLDTVAPSASHVVDHNLVEPTESSAGTTTATATITFQAGSSIDTGGLASNAWDNIGGTLWHQASPYGGATLDIANGKVTFELSDGLDYLRVTQHPTTSFRVPLTDAAGNTATITVTFTIDGANDAPVTNGESYTTDEDAPLVINAAAGLLANDSDAESDSLAAILATGPAHGTLTLNPDGSLTYTPVANYHGADSFTYKANDGQAESSAATVNITVTSINDAPSGADKQIDLIEDQSHTFTAADFGFTDPADSNSLWKVKISTLPGMGALTFDGNPVTANQLIDVTHIQLLVWTPYANGYGVSTFTFQVVDDGGTANGGVDTDPMSKTITFLLSSDNDVPVAVNDTANATKYQATVTGNVLTGPGTDTDAENDPLTVSAIAGGTVGQMRTGIYGRLFLNADGSFSYVADTMTAVAVGATANDVFTYTVSDGNGGADTATLTFTVAGTATGNANANGLLGSAAANTLTGLGGNDRLDGLDGNDVLIGGTGADILNGGNHNDIFRIAGTEGVGDRFSGGAGTDRIQVTGTAVTTLAGFNATAASVEQWTGNGKAVIGTAAVDVFDFTGLASMSGLASVNGGAGNDRLTGSKFADTLMGEAGNDSLVGGAGNDILIGGLGKDTLTGGIGNDIFRFLLKTDSLTGANADVITDFDDPGKGDDRIDLAGVYGPALAYIHVAAFTKAGQVRINDIAGADVLVEVNTGGSLAADFAIRLTATTLASMTKSDFVL